MLFRGWKRGPTWPGAGRELTGFEGGPTYVRLPGLMTARRFIEARAAASWRPTGQGEWGMTVLITWDPGVGSR